MKSNKTYILIFSGRFYYWDEENDVVSWLPPSHPRALITDSAAHFREERHMVEGDKYSEDEKKSDSDSDSSSDSSTSSTETKRRKKRYSSSDKVNNLLLNDLYYGYF